MMKRPTFTPLDALIIQSLLKDARLTYDERTALKNAFKRLEELETDKAWSNPYAQAISLLENAARSYEGGYG